MPDAEVGLGRQVDERPRRSDGRWILVPAFAPMVVFWEAVAGRRIIAPGDGHTYYLPLHDVVSQQWRAGILPVWDRGTFGGAPLLAMHQGAALHPAALLRALLPPVAGHNATVLAALVLAGVGAHLLAHRLTDDHPASAVAGCAFALCGFQFAHLGHVAVLSTAAWLPWLLWAADRLVTAASVRRAAWAAAVVALAALSGHGQMLAYGLLAASAYAIVLAGRTRLRALAWVAGSIAGGLGLAGVQLVPVAVALGSTGRSGLTHAQAIAYSQDPGGLVLLLAPLLHGNARPDGPVTTAYLGPWTLTELSGYVGAAAVVLAVVGVVAARRDRRVVALLVLGAVSLLVALGDTTPLSHLVHAVPGLGQMRSWARYTIGVQLAVAVLAAVGVARARSRPIPLRPTALVAGALAVAAVVVAVASIGDRRVDGAELLFAAGAPLVAAVLTAVVVGLVRHRPGVLIALLVLVVVDPVAGFGWWFRWRTSSPTPDVAEALVEGRTVPPWGPIPDAPGGIDRYLWAGDPLLASRHTPRVAGAGGDLAVTGMDPLAPADHLEVTGATYWGTLRRPRHLLSPRSHLLDLLRVTVVARDDGRGGVERDERTPALPEAFLVSRTRPVDRAGAVAAAIGDAPLEPSTEAVVEGRCPQCPHGAAPGSAGRVGPVSWHPSRARVEIDADRPALLVVSQSWADGWSATVDGRPAPVVRADGVVQGVPVPAGSSTVELRYRPPGLMLGAALSATAAVALGALLAVDRRRRRHRQAGNQSRESRASGVSSHPVQIG